MYKYKIFFLIILVQFSVYSQSYTLSIEIKSSALHTEQFQDNSDKYDNSFNFYPLSIYLGNMFIVDDNYQIVISPGFLFGGEIYGGFETGIYLRRNIGDKFFGGIGANFHYNFGVGHGTTVYEYVPDGWETSLGILIGIRLSKSGMFVINYRKTLSEDYGYTEFEGNILPRKLYSIIQAGFEFNLLDL